MPAVDGERRLLCSWWRHDRASQPPRPQPPEMKDGLRAQRPVKARRHERAGDVRDSPWRVVDKFRFVALSQIQEQTEIVEDFPPVQEQVLLREIPQVPVVARMRVHSEETSIVVHETPELQVVARIQEPSVFVTRRVARTLDAGADREKSC